MDGGNRLERCLFVLSLLPRLTGLRDLWLVWEITSCILLNHQLWYGSHMYFVIICTIPTGWIQVGTDIGDIIVYRLSQWQLTHFPFEQELLTQVFQNLPDLTLRNWGSKVFSWFFVYYEETKWDLKRILIYQCRCNERLKTKDEGSMRLTYTGLCGGLEHLKIETRLRG